MIQQAELDYESIKAQVSITEVLSHYVSVPPHHKSTYRIPCPFHMGDSDNLKIDEEAGMFWCYVCKVGGDVITLVAKFDNTNNSTAAKKLMGSNGIIQTDSFLRLWRKTTRQMEWMNKQVDPPALDEGEIPATQDLFTFRSFTKQAIDHFGLRAIPGSGWGAGIYIPIRNESGTLMGYSIRQNNSFLAAQLITTGRKLPKYLNTTGLGKEGLVYGLHEAKEAILSEGFVYLVEGQFDCISMWDAGYKNVVSPMGSTLSYQQAQVLMGVTSAIKIVFDGDEAGREGAALVKKQFASAFKIEIIHLPEGCDPATADLGALLS